MLIELPKFSGGGNGGFISLRCPGCRQIGTFEPLTGVADLWAPDRQVWLSQRRCPNPDCRTHVFCIHTHQNKVLRAYPPERIDFDPKGIPDRILKTFSEALACHAEGLYTSAAIMIRRTLEELCEDKQSTGANLKERIGSLRSNIVLPEELFIALDDLRLLGNDAAHIEAKSYDSVGQPELEIAIELTKEILKGVYQLDGLVNKLRALKKS